MDIFTTRGRVGANHQPLTAEPDAKPLSGNEVYQATLERKSTQSSFYRGNGHWLSHYPRLVAEWHPQKNGVLLPEQVSYSSAKHDAYDRVWHDNFAFLTVTNGDCIALVEDGDNSPVYYLSHDDGEGHGVLLAPSVFSFLDQLSQLAFAGPEDWLLLPLVQGKLA
jgi:hypothetical protein